MKYHSEPLSIFKLFVKKSQNNLMCMFILLCIDNVKEFLVHLLLVSCLMPKLFTKYPVHTLPNNVAKYVIQLRSHKLY